MAVSKVSKVKKGINIETGSQLGLFLGLIHLGLQRGEYQGKVNYKDQVLLMFELPDVTLEDGRPVTISSRETHALTKRSNLLKAVKAFHGGKEVDEVDWAEEVGKPVLLEIKENSKGTGVKISGYMAAPTSLTKNLKPLMNESKLLLDVDQISDKELKELPEWIQKVINERVKEEPEVDSSIDF